MIARGWLVAAASVVLSGAVLAVVASNRRDAENEKILTEAHAAAATADSARARALAQSRVSDSIAAVDSVVARRAINLSDSLQKRLARLSSLQPTGKIEPLPVGQEPAGTTWQELYFVTDSALVQEHAARLASEHRARLFQSDRDSMKVALGTDATAIHALNNAVAAALAKNECHILRFIACPSRKASFIGGGVLAAAAVLYVKR